MLSKIREFVKTHLDDILLAIAIVLISLFSFAVGFLAAKYQERESIKIEAPKGGNL